MTAAVADRGGMLDPVHGAVLNTHKFPLAAAERVFDKTMVSFDTTGYLVPAADDPAQAGRKVFFALEGADNTTGAAGAVVVDVMIRGTANMEKGNLVQADVGNIAYVADDQTLTSTPAANNRPVGTIIKVGGNRAYVQIG